MEEKKKTETNSAGETTKASGKAPKTGSAVPGTTGSREAAPETTAITKAAPETTAASPETAIPETAGTPQNQRTQELPTVSTPHDKGYKKSLSRPSEFLHFLKKYVKADWTMELKESDLILCDKEMLERDYEGKEADLLYRVSMPDGREAFIFILQELQSYVDYTMIFRILVYVVNTLVKYFLDTDRRVREQAGFRLPAMVPILFYNGQDSWTAARSLKEYQNSGDIFGDYILDLKYYLVDLSELEEEYILSTNTVLDNIMYCDKYRKKLELAGAIRTAYNRGEKLGLQETEEFRRWVKHILLSVCGNKEAVVEEILSWAGNGEDDMAFKYNIIRAFEDERAEGKKEGKKEGIEEGQFLKLISLVRKKIHKNMPPKEIADILEEEETVIAPICDLIQGHPEWDDERICFNLPQGREHHEKPNAPGGNT